MAAEGGDAFYIQLDRVASEPFDEVLGSEALGRFRAWRRGNKQATFFLDSVDEAKFHKAADFLTALDRFRGAVASGGLGRLRLLVSSRISEWRPQSDASDLLIRFPAPPQQPHPRGSATPEDGAEGQPPLLIVQLEPLDGTRVEKLVRETSGVDPASFLQALEEHHAWEFARRPVDVIGLLSFWSQFSRLGSLTELLEHDLRQKLRETDAREAQDPLNENQARDGAEALAAATVFCRRFAFRVRDDAGLSSEDGLDAYTCLSADWRPEQCRALLARAIFDSASYGRIRFHHRRVSEYLASQWVTKRVHEGCPIAVLEELLFARIGDRRVIRPALAPVAAWLSCGNSPWNDEVRSWVLEAAPWIYMQFGDAETLPLEFKHRIIRALVTHYQDRSQVWIGANPESLRRLADHRLADDVSAIIRNREISEDLRATMLQLVRHGRLTGCLDTALDIIASPDESEHLKIYAAAAVRDCADTPRRRRLAEIARDLPQMPSMLCACVCEAVFPGAIDAAGLAGLLRKASGVRAHRADLPWHLKRHLDNVLTPDTSARLLAELLKLAETPPCIAVDGKSSPVSAQFAWLDEVIPTVLRVLLEKASLCDDEAETAAKGLWVLTHMRKTSAFPRELGADFNALTGQHAAVRQRYFWRLVDDWRQKHTEDPGHSFLLLRHPELARLGPEDLDWLLDCVRSHPVPRDRELTLRFATEIWIDSGHKRRDRRRIRQAVATDAELLVLYRELTAASRWTWLRVFWYGYVRRQLTDRWVWRRRVDRIRRIWRHVREQWTLLRHLRLLASGKPVGWLMTLADEASGKSGGSHWAPRDWLGLQRKRGRLIARAAKAGCKRAWRECIPLLPHEKPNPRETEFKTVIGLAGLQAEYEDGDWDSHRLSEKDARLAARYAVNELNGFPIWFTELAAHHPKAVGEVLGDCIRGEWQFSDDRQDVHEVLSDLTWHGQGLVHLARDAVLARLRDGDPPNISILESGLTVLATCYGEAFPELAQLAAERLKVLPLDSRRFVLWLAMWIQLDAGAAIRCLQRSERDDLGRAKVIEQLCSALGGRRIRRHPLVPDPDYLAPNHLRRLIPLVYLHVRPNEDLDRLGKGVYSPTSRDEAQDFRNGLLDRLAQSEASEADLALRELAEDPILARQRDWILHLIDRRAEEQADLPPWNPQDIRSFAKEYETEPKTDYELFRIVCRRLADIKHDVEKSDNSLREEVRVGDHEACLRRWFARKLSERSRRRYTVPQEEEIDQQQRPDIRIENPRTAPVAIELKWADRWSLAGLLERLENQLVGQYLRAHNARYGVFLLGTIGQKEYWQNPENQRRVAFADVLQLLAARAREIVSHRPDVADIAVVGIDFRDPRGKSRA